MQITHQTPYVRPYATNGPNFFDTPDENWLKFKKTGVDVDIVEKSANYYAVRARKADVYNSIRKKDVVPKNPSGPIHNKTIEFAIQHFHYIKSTPCEPAGGYDFVMNTSPSLPFVKMNGNYHTKADVMADPDLNRWVAENAFNLSFPVVDMCSDKQEFLPLEDLTKAEPKVRTTFGSSLLSLFKESYLFDGQNEKLKTYHQQKSVKYGLVKQYGGFNALGRAHELFDVHYQGDIRGLDRVVDLSDVYEVRRRLLNLDDYSSVLFDYWLIFIKNPMFLHPAGMIIKCMCGNHSGRKNTTCDNSMKLKIVNIYGRIKLFMQQGVPLVDITYPMVEDCVEESFYGDDSMCSILAATIGMSLEEWKDFVRGYYADFGLEMKESEFYVTLSKIGGRLCPKHSFLGSYFHYEEKWNQYVPSPRYGKVCASITQRPPRPMGLEIYFERLVALTVLAHPNDQIFSILLKYIQWFIDSHPADASELITILGSINTDQAIRASVRSLYTGYEAQLSY